MKRKNYTTHPINYYIEIPINYNQSKYKNYNLETPWFVLSSWRPRQRRQKLTSRVTGVKQRTIYYPTKDVSSIGKQGSFQPGTPKGENSHKEIHTIHTYSHKHTHTFGFDHGIDCTYKTENIKPKLTYIHAIFTHQHISTFHTQESTHEFTQKNHGSK